MGFDVVGPGTGQWAGNDDWQDLMFKVQEAPPELNRNSAEAYALSRTLRDDPHTKTWIARGDDLEVIGFAALHRGIKQSEQHTASLRVHVFDGAREQGVGTRLVEAALVWADENNISRITATPYVEHAYNFDYGRKFKVDSLRKMQFFMRHGFVLEGTMRNAAKVGDELVDVALLARVR